MATSSVIKQATPREPSVARSIGLAAAMLAASALLSRVLGLGREMLIAGLYAASGSVDAYRASFTLPDLLNYFIAGGALSITFVPMFSACLARDDEEGGWRLFSTVTTTMGVVFLAFTLVGEAVAPRVVAWMNPGFAVAGASSARLDLAVTMTRIVIPAQLAFYVGGLLQSTLFVRGIFWPAAVAPLIYNLGIILGGVLLRPWLGIEGFSYGVLAGAILGPLGMPLWASRRRVRFRWNLSPRDPGFVEYLKLSLPLMIGVSLVTVDEWLVRYFASEKPGEIAQLGYARTLMMVLFAMLGQATGQAALPYLTRLFHGGQERAMGTVLARSAQQVAFFAVVAAGGLIAMAAPFTAATYMHHRFTAQDTYATSGLLVLFAAGLVGWSLQAVVVRGFYARKDTLTPMIIGTITVFAAIPLYRWLYHVLGQGGLALASSLGITANAAATLLAYRLRKGTLPLRPIFMGVTRGLLFASVGGLAAYGAGRLFGPAPFGSSILDNLIRLGLMATAFCLAVVPVAIWVKPPELYELLGKVAGRCHRETEPLGNEADQATDRTA